MNEMVKDRLRQALMERATLGSSTTYKALADRVCIVPPQTIHRICEALEILMEEDVAAGRPMLTALCVSKTGANMPAQGFFLKARLLGVFSGHP
jgi:DNA-binding Xre family transcriptional regulator